MRVLEAYFCERLCGAVADDDLFVELCHCCAELCHAHAVEMQNLFEISAVFH